MKIPECHECIGVHICNAVHHRESIDCINFHKLVEEKLTSTNKQSESLLLVEAVDKCLESFDSEGRCPVCGSYSQV